MITPTCTCCGINPQVRNERHVDEFYFDMAIKDYCFECNDNRCDAYPGTCPMKNKETTPEQLARRALTKTNGRETAKAFAWFLIGGGMLLVMGLVVAFSVAVVIEAFRRIWP